MAHVQYITLLGIESSCDDTSAAVWRDGKILSNITAGQEIHRKYGGVVPELASRSHQKSIVPVVDQALESAGIKLSEINAIAYTQGPGLMGSLLVGSSFAKGLSLALQKPLIAVNHLEAHVLSPLLGNAGLQTPYLCLLVSGGHTQIVKVQGPAQLEVLGQTLDDAAGEAFDKVAKILGLPYPGGPLIDRYALSGNPKAFPFNIGKVPGLDFSFSGFKTSVLYFVRDEVQKNATFVDSNLSDLCASAQYTIVHYLMEKLKKAMELTGINHIAIAGGVAANSLLRSELTKLADRFNGKAVIPPFEYCTDNAAMIASAGYYKFTDNRFAELNTLTFAGI